MLTVARPPKIRSCCESCVWFPFLLGSSWVRGWCLARKRTSPRPRLAIRTVDRAPEGRLVRRGRGELAAEQGRRDRQGRPVRPVRPKRADPAGLVVQGTPV